MLLAVVRSYTFQQQPKTGPLRGRDGFLSSKILPVQNNCSPPPPPSSQGQSPMCDCLCQPGCRRAAPQPENQNACRKVLWNQVWPSLFAASGKKTDEENRRIFRRHQDAGASYHLECDQTGPGPCPESLMLHVATHERPHLQHIHHVSQRSNRQGTA